MMETDHKNIFTDSRSAAWTDFEVVEKCYKLSDSEGQRRMRRNCLDTEGCVSESCVTIQSGNTVVTS